MGRDLGSELLIHRSSMAAHFLTISAYGCDLCLGHGLQRRCPVDVCASRLRDQLQRQLLGDYRPEGTDPAPSVVWYRGDSRWMHRLPML